MKSRFLYRAGGAICFALITFAGCGQREVKSVTAAAPAETAHGAGAGLVVKPSDSPKLQQLRVEPVRTAEVPTDEVISPGKIEANPGAISRIVFPAPGRISSVLVKPADPVQKGTPWIT